MPSTTRSGVRANRSSSTAELPTGVAQDLGRGAAPPAELDLLEDEQPVGGRDGDAVGSRPEERAERLARSCAVGLRTPDRDALAVEVRERPGERLRAGPDDAVELDRPAPPAELRVLRAAPRHPQCECRVLRLRTGLD